MSTSGRPHLIEIESPPTSAVRWRVVEIDRPGHRARLEPYVAMPALSGALDEAFGVASWGNRYVPFGEGVVGCELTVEGVPKSFIARGVAGHADPTELAAAALTGAAALHGVALPVDPAIDAWVEYDLDEGEPLYWPNPAEARSSGITRSPAETGADAPTGTDALTDTPSRPSSSPPEDASQPAAKSEGQRAIDRLVDRLRDAGHGLEAARLVTAHKGYGTDPDAARELYARLRQLLLGDPPT